MSVVRNVRSVCLRASVGSLLLFVSLTSSLAQTLSAQTPQQTATDPFLVKGSRDPQWPHLRGPNYDGRSPEINLAEEWPDAGPPVLWIRDLGHGYSGFTCVGDRVYTQAQTLGGQFVMCLDADTGEPVWEHWYDWPYEAAGVYPGPRATPTYADGRIFFSAPSGLVSCLDAATGEWLWSTNPKEKYSGKGTDFGYSISPTIYAGKVILPVGGKGASLVALDVHDGSEIWKSGDEAASYTSAYPIVVDGTPLLITFMENTLSGYDPETGRQYWSLFLSQGYDEHAAWPLYSEPYLMTCSPFRDGSKLYKLSGGDRPAIEDVWQRRLMSNDIFSSVLVDGSVYGFDVKDAQAKAQRSTRGTFRCMDFLTGEQRWETDQVKHCAVLEADGKLILWTDLGELILARCTSERYDELDRVQILGGEICWTQPSLHRGRLYVRNQSRAVCIYLGEPDLLHSKKKLTPLSAADVSTEPYRDWSFLLAVEPEYAFDIPSQSWFRDWYLYSLFGVMAVAGAATGLVLFVRRSSVQTAWWTFWILAFILGAAGTTLLGRWRQEFTFTWPVCTFVAFQAWVYQSEWGRRSLVAHPRRWSYLVGAIFLLTCITYYLICRRLSLVFEWSYLFGFLPALPLLVAAIRIAPSRFRFLWGGAATAAAFSAYYWGSVLLLMLRY